MGSEDVDLEGESSCVTSARIKSGSSRSEVGEAEREGDGECEARSDSDSERKGEELGRESLCCLFDIDGRPRDLLDFAAPFFVVEPVAFDALGRGGEKEGRLRLGAADAIAESFGYYTFFSI